MLPATTVALQIEWRLRTIVLPSKYGLSCNAYCFRSGVRVYYVYVQFTASGSVRLYASKNDISADTDPAGRECYTVEHGIEGADLHRLPRLRPGNAVRLGQDAEDQELAPCSPPNSF
jgi:hypothetical protein